MRMRDGSFEFRLNIFDIDVKERILAVYNKVCDIFGDEHVNANVSQARQEVMIYVDKSGVMNETHLMIILMPDGYGDNVLGGVTYSKRNRFSGNEINIKEGVHTARECINILERLS